jgi:hypothetical protein
MRRLRISPLLAFALFCGQTAGQSQIPNTPEQVRAHFRSVHQRLLEMAKDDKYGFKLKPEMRSFGAVMVHVASGAVYASKSGPGRRSTGTNSIPRITRRRQPWLH